MIKQTTVERLKKIRNTAVFGGLVTGGIILTALPYCGAYMIGNIGRPDKGKVAELVARFKACPDRHTTGSTSAGSADALKRTAVELWVTGDYLNAGILYARMGKAGAVLDIADSLTKYGMDSEARQVLKEAVTWQTARRIYAADTCEK
jgi:hypothetical protein